MTFKQRRRLELAQNKLAHDEKSIGKAVHSGSPNLTKHGIRFRIFNEKTRRAPKLGTLGVQVPSLAIFLLAGPASIEE